MKPSGAAQASILNGLSIFNLLATFVLGSILALGENRAIAVGYLGGWERAHDDHRAVRQLALRLRDTTPIDIETFSNHDQRQALRYLKQRLDQDHNGKLDDSERAGAVVILYGQSMGGAAVVKTARTLKKWGVPVRLTVQVDSVGARDHRIPSNVGNAANFFQQGWMTVRGERQIVADDPARTRIVANEEMYYPLLLPPLRQPESWMRRRLGGGHARMEADPIVWARVELLIRRALISKDL